MPLSAQIINGTKHVCNADTKLPSASITSMLSTDTIGNPKQATNYFDTKQCKAPLSTRATVAVGCYMHPS